MREITQKIYQFNELKPEIQQRVIKKFSYDNSFWDEQIFQEYMNSLWTDLLETNKIKKSSNNRLYYSLSHSQGDGVCFAGGFYWDNNYIKITHSGMYYHEKSVSFDIEDNEGNDVQEDIYSRFENIFSDICIDLKKKGYEFISDSDKDENIIGNIEANEYEFYEDGKMF